MVALKSLWSKSDDVFTQIVTLCSTLCTCLSLSVAPSCTLAQSVVCAQSAYSHLLLLRCCYVYSLHFG